MINMKWRYGVFVSSLLCGSVMLGACQMFIPNAQGLPPLEHMLSTATPNETSQQQAEILWRDQSFSFLLYQQRQGQSLHVIAMTLAGQVLFELQYDGQKIKVLQRYPALKTLPLDFLMRDIWWATMPQTQVEQALQSVNYRLQQQQGQRQIFQQDTLKLNVHYHEQNTQIDNPSVPYRIVLSTVQTPFLEDSTTPTNEE